MRTQKEKETTSERQACGSEKPSCYHKHENLGLGSNKAQKVRMICFFFSEKPRTFLSVLRTKLNVLKNMYLTSTKHLAVTFKKLQYQEGALSKNALERLLITYDVIST